MEFLVKPTHLSCTHNRMPFSLKLCSELQILVKMKCKISKTILWANSFITTLSWASWVTYDPIACCANVGAWRFHCRQRCELRWCECSLWCFFIFRRNFKNFWWLFYWMPKPYLESRDKCHQTFFLHERIKESVCHGASTFRRTVISRMTVNK